MTDRPTALDRVNADRRREADFSQYLARATSKWRAAPPKPAQPGESEDDAAPTAREPDGAYGRDPERGLDRHEGIAAIGRQLAARHAAAFPEAAEDTDDEPPPRSTRPEREPGEDPESYRQRLVLPRFETYRGSGDDGE